jgi:hypothetical protein|tara:strand:- start:183 stop:929 length:747 start_codon:yes stop_codon:yes gene_type:complete
MYRERILNTRTKHPAAIRLKEAMLEYHDFQNTRKTNTLTFQMAKLAQWQSERLKHSHKDLYCSPVYQKGLSFLFTDLYSDTDFSDRDRDLERIFPKMIKLLPSSVLETVCLLVELNMLTQILDQDLATKLFLDLSHANVNEQSYCEAYRLCNNEQKRAYQIKLTEDLGKKLDKYARSQVILYSLKLSRGAAESAGLSALHHFLSSGFKAFHSMQNIDILMSNIAHRETHFLQEIMSGNTQPFEFNTET